MGIDPAPFWANLYLYSYEKSHIMELKSSSTALARKYKHASRFIDDECNLNDGGQFGKSYRDIYPKELELKCEHQGNRATFLELDIVIENGVFVYKLFDKRDDFPFTIVRMPDLSSNIPDHVFYGSFTAEVKRIGRATLRYQDFLPRLKEIFSRMHRQGGKIKKLKKSIGKAMSDNMEVLKKFGKNTQKLVSDISN